MQCGSLEARPFCTPRHGKGALRVSRGVPIFPCVAPLWPISVGASRTRSPALRVRHLRNSTCPPYPIVRIRPSASPFHTGRRVQPNVDRPGHYDIHSLSPSLHATMSPQETQAPDAGLLGAGRRRHQGREPADPEPDGAQEQPKRCATDRPDTRAPPPLRDPARGCGADTYSHEGRSVHDRPQVVRAQRTRGRAATPRADEPGRRRGA
jgi:hypothetical protein